MDLSVIAAFAIACELVILTASERMMQKNELSIGKEPQAVWQYLVKSNSDSDTRFHMPPYWQEREEVQGTKPIFYAWPESVPGSKPVHCYWDSWATSHSCHCGAPLQNEGKAWGIPDTSFWIMEEPGPFRVGLHLCWNLRLKSHTIHPLPPWDSETCDLTNVQGYAWLTWPKKITYRLDIIYSVEGGSKGTVEQEVKYMYGLTSHTSQTRQESTELAAELHAEVGVEAPFATASVSADVKSTVGASVSETWESTSSENMTETKKVVIDLSEPCYLYQMKVEMDFMNSTIVVGSKTLVQTNESISDTVSVKVIDIFGFAR